LSVGRWKKTIEQVVDDDDDRVIRIIRQPGTRAE
jgi:hypothetical protein